jgi:hypothetical protein
MESSRMSTASKSLKARQLAERMAQIIHPDDSGVVGSRILRAVEEHEPVDAETFALAILKFRQEALIVSRDHMEYAHALMRVMLDNLLAREQARSQRTQFVASIVLGIASLILAGAALKF